MMINAFTTLVLYDTILALTKGTTLKFCVTNALLADTLVHIPPGYSIKHTFI